jgi:hypothetical protein
MADWPEAAELEKFLNLSEDPASWTDQVERIMSAAIAQVKDDVGAWDELTDEPDDALAQAALRMGELLAERPTANDLGKDPVYVRLLKGHRRRFAIAGGTN